MWSQSILDEFLDRCYTYNMAEKILVKAIGGPKDGETRVFELGEAGWVWPPPMCVYVPGYSGFYKRESYSNLPEEPRNPHVMRGAQYQWVED